jgi:hypothetical protein
MERAMHWLDDLLRCYIAAQGRLVVAHEVAHRLGRPPTDGELTMAMRAVQEAAWASPPDVRFDQPRQVDASWGGGSGWR